MFQATMQKSYHKVPDSDSETDSTYVRNLDWNWHSIWQKISLLAWILSICLWATFLPLGLHILRRGPDDKACSQQLSVWSPAFPAIEIVDRKFENSFFHASPYRGKPTANLEKAWDDLWNGNAPQFEHQYYSLTSSSLIVGLVAFDEDKLPLLNKSKTQNWRRAKDGRVLASLEVFHDLHCLSFIRQYTYRNEYDYSDNIAFGGGDEMIREHVDHCIESLRLKIECTSDVTPYMEVLSAQSPGGRQLDFDTQHRCRNFDNIREWYKRNTVSWAEA
ncbi:hypothetical protein G7Y89_g12182 [Cudoniella acicularis]|uniref:Cyclochlorotine biosynthesis protein O n=1 Tax=Cudoniella acicularis TaxID=354080 RepID=A0A8H4RC16_9HELO|nr:hypothetical protein G7Y89_g12182 [Cudoniella acicularis]